MVATSSILIAILFPALSFIFVPIAYGKTNSERRNGNQHIFPNSKQGAFASDLTSYDIITPLKVTKTGNFLSRDLLHFHETPATKKRSRTKRKLRREDIVYYSLKFGDKTLVVKLQPNHLFLASHFVVEKRGETGGFKIGNTTSILTTLGSAATRCYFTGHVLNNTNSKVALSTCDGLIGFIKMESDEYLIEPIKDRNRKTGDAHFHLLYRKSDFSKTTDHFADEENKCNNSNVDYDKALKDRMTWENLKVVVKKEERLKKNHKKRRRKRSVSLERNVEALVVADKMMIDYYADEDLNTYILTVMNMVSSLFHDRSIGNAINIIVVKIILLENSEHENEELKISNKADETLASFCKWQQMVNPNSDDHPYHHDVAILLTRYNICSKSNELCSTLGLAEIAGMCQPNRSCNVNEDTGLQVAYTIAHEIGHNFGMSHDGPLNGCGSSNGVSEHVMSPHLATDGKPITWSNCSRNEITKFFDLEWGECLIDKPQQVDYNFPQLPPGAMYDAAHQCRLIYGGNATHCDDMDVKCETLWCKVDNRCVTRLEPAADGTQCGKHKWCLLEKCVTMGEESEAIHGSWGQWSPWSECSRTCGAGIMTSSRPCDNPPPTNGGKYCIGERTKYKICNMQECPREEISFRAIQCSHFDKIPYNGRNHTWRAVTLQRNPCQLHCKPDNEFYSVQMKDTVIDGTPCKPGTRDMCIHGICKRVTCDWAIEGSAQEDRCGLCHGDGTQCVTNRGSFLVTEGLSYQHIVTFPSGARNIKAEEMGDAAPNYLAIRDEETGIFYLNGNWIIQWSGEYNIDGTLLFYTRENETETLLIPGPTRTTLALMLLFQTSNPGIRWEYTLPHENATYTPEFHWEYSDWSICTRTCGGGVQISKSQCMEKEAGLVEDRYCDEVRPENRKQECNNHPCPAWWWSGPWQPCSISCGTFGIKKRTVICVRSYGPTEQMALLDSDCILNEKPHELEPCDNLSICSEEEEEPLWTVGPWSKSCGDDPCEFETRDVRCSEDAGRCDPMMRPVNIRQCGNTTCGYWETSEWSECSTTCGEGVQFRDVFCVSGTSCMLRSEPRSVKECKVIDCTNKSLYNHTKREENKDDSDKKVPEESFKEIPKESDGTTQIIAEENTKQKFTTEIPEKLFEQIVVTTLPKEIIKQEYPVTSDNVTKVSEVNNKDIKTVLQDNGTSLSENPKNGEVEHVSLDFLLDFNSSDDEKMQNQFIQNKSKNTKLKSHPNVHEDSGTNVENDEEHKNSQLNMENKDAITLNNGQINSNKEATQINSEDVTAKNQDRGTNGEYAISIHQINSNNEIILNDEHKITDVVIQNNNYTDSKTILQMNTDNNPMTYDTTTESNYDIYQSAVQIYSANETMEIYTNDNETIKPFTTSNNEINLDNETTQVNIENISDNPDFNNESTGFDGGVTVLHDFTMSKSNIAADSAKNKINSRLTKNIYNDLSNIYINNTIHIINESFVSSYINIAYNNNHKIYSHINETLNVSKNSLQNTENNFDSSAGPKIYLNNSDKNGVNVNIFLKIINIIANKNSSYDSIRLMDTSSNREINKFNKSNAKINIPVIKDNKLKFNVNIETSVKSYPAIKDIETEPKIKTNESSGIIDATIKSSGNSYKDYTNKTTIKNTFEEDRVLNTSAQTNYTKHEEPIVIVMQTLDAIARANNVSNKTVENNNLVANVYVNSDKGNILSNFDHSKRNSNDMKKQLTVVPQKIIMEPNFIDKQDDNYTYREKQTSLKSKSQLHDYYDRINIVKPNNENYTIKENYVETKLQTEIPEHIMKAKFGLDQSKINDTKSEVQQSLFKGKENIKIPILDQLDEKAKQGVKIKIESLQNQFSDINDYDYLYEDYFEMAPDIGSTEVTQAPKNLSDGYVHDKKENINDSEIISVRKNNASKNEMKKLTAPIGNVTLKLTNNKYNEENNITSTIQLPNNLSLSEFSDDLQNIYKWTVGEWSKCSDPCGGGTQLRAVECQNSFNDSVVPRGMCDEVTSPNDFQQCNAFPCLNWTLSEFGPCSEECGEGNRTRNATCPTEGHCHTADIPNLQEKCVLEKSCFKWKEGPWSMCTQSCGGGYQIRYVKCIDVRTQKAVQRCGGEKPLHKKTCNSNDCPKENLDYKSGCKDHMSTKLCKRLIHMCSTKFFKVKCCRTCSQRIK